MDSSWNWIPVASGSLVIVICNFFSGDEDVTPTFRETVPVIVLPEGGLSRTVITGAATPRASRRGISRAASMVTAIPRRTFDGTLLLEESFIAYGCALISPILEYMINRR